MLASYNEISNSFRAVQDFLRTKGHLGTDTKFVDSKFSIDHPHTFNVTLEVECKDYLDSPTFIMHCDTFKANGYYRPVWSSYHLFTWDDSTEQLKVELNNKKYTIS